MLVVSNRYIYMLRLSKAKFLLFKISLVSALVSYSGFVMIGASISSNVSGQDGSNADFLHCMWFSQ